MDWVWVAAAVRVGIVLFAALASSVPLLALFVAGTFALELGLARRYSWTQRLGALLMLAATIAAYVHVTETLERMIDKWDLREDARVFVYRAAGSRCESGELDRDLDAVELDRTHIVAENRSDAWAQAARQTRHAAWTLVLAADARLDPEFQRTVTREIRTLPTFDVAFLTGASKSDRNAIFRSSRLERVVASADVDADCVTTRLRCETIRALV